MTTRLRTVSLAAPALIGLLLVPSVAAAQSSGLEGGLTLSKFNVQLSGAAGPISETTNLTGGSGGMFWILTDGTFTGQIEALYTRRGTETRDGTSLWIDYFEIPVGTRIRLVENQDSSFYVMAGGSFAFKLKASQSGNEIVPSVDDLDGFDTGIFAGVGFDAGKLLLNVRYYWGGRDLADGPAELYHRSLQFMIGVKLN
jgi:hypothetical protein